ncbi:MAG: DinB family protein [Acidobacteria bacterium]|nr:DinB family protein [Acidobacteriota bacterium]MBI3470667.1 DinB family protein [Candidatus Solibacter usitatus]
MTISEALLPEFDQEMGHTRRTLDRLPDDKLGWKPHEKSMTMGQLAVHIASMLDWAVTTLQQDSFDYAPEGAPPYQPPVANSRNEVLAMFDKGLAASRAALAAVSDEQMGKPWSLLAGGKTIFTMPRSAVLRSMIMNHNVHHRAQLGVYLRLNDIPVPAIYGPSADEAGA